MKILPVQLNPYKSTEAVQDRNDCPKPCPKPLTSTTDLKYMPVYFGSVLKSVSKPTQELTTSFAREIADQPRVLRNLINKYFIKAGTVNMDLNITPEQMQKIKRIHLIDSGSSKNASEMSRAYIENATQIPVSIESASEFMDQTRPLNSVEDLVIYVSQSGQTADTLKSLRKTNAKGIHSVAVTNTPDSKIAKTAKAHVYLDAGEEHAVAATKTVTSSIFNLMAIGLKLGEIKGTLNPETIEHLVSYLKHIPEKIEYMLKHTEDIDAVAKLISKSNNIYYYAKGTNIGAAKEGALKLTETTGKRVIADSSGEALHGTFASIQPEDPVLEIIVSRYGTDGYNSALKNITEIINKRHLENVIVMKTSSNWELQRHLDSKFGKINYLYIPGTREELTPLLTTVKFQQLTEAVTRKLKIDPDNGNGFLTKFRKEI